MRGQGSKLVSWDALHPDREYSIVGQAWTILFAGRACDASGKYDVPKLRAAIARYDALWAEWRALEKEHSSCATIYKDMGFEGRPGMGAPVDRYCRVMEKAQYGNK